MPGVWRGLRDTYCGGGLVNGALNLEPGQQQFCMGRKEKQMHRYAEIRATAVLHGAQGETDA